MFTQFSSDRDDITKGQLAYGQSLMRLLRQEQYHPLKMHQQVILLVAALSHAMQDVPLEELSAFRDGLLDFAERQIPELCQEIEEVGAKLTQEQRERILDMVRRYQSKLAAVKENG